MRICEKCVFQEKTFHIPTFCDICGRLLLGIFKQGVQCKECKLVVHKRCSSFMHNNEVLKHAVRELDSEAYIDSGKCTASTICGSIREDYFDTTLGDEAVQMLLNFIGAFSYQYTAIDATLKKEQQRLLPPLRLHSTAPFNMTRFIYRVGLFFRVIECIYDIWSWKSPTVTICAFLLFYCICYRPLLVCCIPFACSIYFIVSNWYVPNVVAAASVKEKDVIVDVGSALVKKNLENLQNMMGIYCDLYDQGMKFRLQIKSMSEAAFGYYMKSLLSGLILTFLGAFLLPTLPCAVLAVLFIFASGLRVFQAFLIVFHKTISEFLNRNSSARSPILISKELQSSDIVVLCDYQVWSLQRKAWINFAYKLIRKEGYPIDVGMTNIQSEIEASGRILKSSYIPYNWEYGLFLNEWFWIPLPNCVSFHRKSLLLWEIEPKAEIIQLNPISMSSSAKELPSEDYFNS